MVGYFQAHFGNSISFEAKLSADDVTSDGPLLAKQFKTGNVMEQYLRCTWLLFRLKG